MKVQTGKTKHAGLICAQYLSMVSNEGGCMNHGR